MAVAHLGLKDKARGGVSQFEARRSGTALGAASEERPVLRRPWRGPERSAASGPLPEPTTTTGEQVVWWQGRRESATLWGSRSSSCPRLSARLASQGTLG
eukprot:7351999-Alexandrium_andersonii.AAC.1